MKKLFGMLSAFLLISLTSAAQDYKVVLQGFYWNYWNSNFPNSYADYLTELAPRLRDLGIDMVWIPPTSKNASTDKVGYAPFDPYDLGDKFQKGSTTTRFGTKDKYLRAVAVMHANGLGVIQDVVLNHHSDAGAANGAGGQDPEPTYSMQNENGYKTFRYVSYATPAPAASIPGNTAAENQAEYWNRSGRWSMNYTNFHPNQWTNTTAGDWAQGGWGPDISYEDNRSYGAASNVVGFNPVQYLDYNRTEARNWIVWLKKQTGVDGFRWDAVKHFPYYIVQDLSWNVKYNASWANGGANMFNVGEWVGNAGEMDNYINQVKFSNGGNEDLIGTFDFSLRSALNGMITSNGNYDLGTIPGQQQTNRFRTVPFVNNHDSFRPTAFNGAGDYTAWDVGNEIVAHINPDDGRIQAAYAIALAVDGSPQIFFEDLFDMSTTNRNSHLPTNAGQLPVRDYLQNLLWCRQKLNFKGGAYNVRWQAQDALVIERSGKALIAVNDNWTTGQNVTNVQTNFGANVQLHDYSGANANDIWTNGSGQVSFWIPPCDGSNVRRGYCVWGPVGIAGGFSPPQNSTTQEWEMSNDLGDSHNSSLKQGGGLPANSQSLRTVGRIFAEAGKNIALNLYQSANPKKNVALVLYNAAGNSILQTVTGSADLLLNYNPPSTNYYTIKVRNNNNTNPYQKVWVKATYTAPKVVATASFPKVDSGEEIEEEIGSIMPNSIELEGNYPNPFNPSTTINYSLPADMKVRLVVYNLLGQEVKVIVDSVVNKGFHSAYFDGSGLTSGIYIYQLQTELGIQTGKMTLAK